MVVNIKYKYFFSLSYFILSHFLSRSNSLSPLLSRSLSRPFLALISSPWALIKKSSPWHTGFPLHKFFQPHACLVISTFFSGLLRVCYQWVCSPFLSRSVSLSPFLSHSLSHPSLALISSPWAPIQKSSPWHTRFRFPLHKIFQPHACLFISTFFSGLLRVCLRWVCSPWA